MAPLKPGPNPSPPYRLKLPKRTILRYICPKCRKNYGDIFGLWFSSKMIGIFKIERICKMCGYIWFTRDF